MPSTHYNTLLHTCPHVATMQVLMLSQVPADVIDVAAPGCWPACCPAVEPGQPYTTQAKLWHLLTSSQVQCCKVQHTGASGVQPPIQPTHMPCTSSHMPGRLCMISLFLLLHSWQTASKHKNLSMFMHTLGLPTPCCNAQSSPASSSTSALITATSHHGHGCLDTAMLGLHEQCRPDLHEQCRPVWQVRPAWLGSGMNTMMRMMMLTLVMIRMLLLMMVMRTTLDWLQAKSALLTQAPALFMHPCLQYSIEASAGSAVASPLAYTCKLTTMLMQAQLLQAHQHRHVSSPPWFTSKGQACVAHDCCYAWSCISIKPLLGLPHVFVGDGVHAGLREAHGW